MLLVNRFLLKRKKLSVKKSFVMNISFKRENVVLLIVACRGVGLLPVFPRGSVPDIEFKKKALTTANI